jgi:hypothetical protein
MALGKHAIVRFPAKIVRIFVDPHDELIKLRSGGEWVLILLASHEPFQPFLVLELPEMFVVLVKLLRL